MNMKKFIYSKHNSESDDGVNFKLLHPISNKEDWCRPKQGRLLQTSFPSLK